MILPAFIAGCEHFLDAREQEVRIRIALVAFDEGVVAGGLGGFDRLGHHAADADVVEGDVKHVRALDQAVIGDDWDAFVRRLLHRRQDRLRIHGEDDEHIGALGNKVLNVGQLLGRGGLSVG